MKQKNQNNRPEILLWEEKINTTIYKEPTYYINNIRNNINENEEYEKRINITENHQEFSIVIMVGTYRIKGWLDAKVEFHENTLLVSGVVGIDPIIIFSFLLLIVPIGVISFLVLWQSIPLFLLLMAITIFLIWTYKYSISNIKKTLLDIILF